MFRRKTVLAGLFVIAFTAIALFPTIALADNAQCLLCHQSQMNTRPAQNFVVAPVNYATACSKCHLNFAGSHPYHNTDSYCGALCHDGWGAALSANVPNYSANLGGGVMGGFASANSTSTDPALLHIIHSKPRWMEDKSFASSSCKSCHAMVACDACHEGAPDPTTHASHAATLSPSSTNNVSRGVLFGNQADPNGYTPLETTTCSAAICHNTSGVAAGSPSFKDDSVHIADPATGYLANPTVVKTGAWVVMKASAYTLGKTSNSNATGATLSVPFNGSQIALVADKDPYRGIAEILIDNVSTGTVDLYNDTTVNQVEVWRSAKLASGDHTITVRVTGTKRLAPVAARGAYIRVDQFKIYTNAPGSVAPRCTSTGCHAGYDPPNHGAQHKLGVSTYSNVTVSGCTDAGAGCHGATPVSYQAAHPASGCLAGPCHNATATNHNDIAFNDPNTCQNCHGGGPVDYVNAPWVSVLTTTTGVKQGHYNETTHTASVSGSVTSGGSASATCANCHNPVTAGLDGLYGQHQGTTSGNVTCVDCHSANAAVTAVVKTAKWNTATCVQCHTTGTLTGFEQHGATAPAVLATSTSSCGAGNAGCHTTYDVHALHKNAAGGCALTGCHDYSKQGARPTTKTCGQVGGCHASYTPSTGHRANTITGNDTTHTATGMTAKVDGTTYDAGGANTCVTCHSSTLEASHGTSVTANLVSPTWTAPMCDECHGGDTSPVTGAVNVIKTTGWPTKTCVECHGAPNGPDIHATYATGHTGVEAVGCTFNTACHGNTHDLRVLHNNSVTSNASTAGCDSAGCHDSVNKDMTSAPKTCGSGGACHTDKTHANHGKKHELTISTSTYADGSGQGVETGCLSSGGGGCHDSLGASNVSTDIAGYHQTTQCATSVCHTSVSKPTHHEPFVCGDCHDSTYAGAVDTTALADLSPAGHYIDASHLATGGIAAVNTGGTANETCSVCHDLSLKTAHTNIATPTKGTKVTCGECHNYSANVTGQVKVFKWTNGACSDCHNASTMVISPQHANALAVSVTATGSAGCASSGLNCHNTTDLHTIHKNASTGCDLAGCHDATNKNIRPTKKSCGATGACHTTYNTNTSFGTHTNSQETTNHAPLNTTQQTQTFLGNTCNACHVVAKADGGLVTEHASATSTRTTNAGNVCLNCHNNAASTAAITSYWSSSETATACAQCHTAALAVHADANATAHTKTTNTGCGNSGPGCHNSNDLSQVGAVTTINTNIHSTCLRCHDRNGSATVPAPGGGNMKWNPANSTCGQGRTCHNTAGAVYAVSGDPIHRSGQTSATTGNDTKHTADATYMASHEDSGTAINICSDCHIGTLASEHATTGPAATPTKVGCTTGGYAGNNAGCHNTTTGAIAAGSAAMVKNNWNGGTKTCANCHTAKHNNIATVHTATSTQGCGASGAGCHTTYDLAALHKGRVGGGGCKLAGCHDTANKSQRPALKTCGSGGGCHSTYFPTSGHRANTINGDDTTHTATGMGSKLDTATFTYNTTCSTCHSSTLKSAHTTVTAVLDSARAAWTTPYCTDCHNSQYAEANSVTTIKTNSWSLQTCDQCHETAANGGNGNGKHTTYTLATHTSLVGTVGTADGCVTGACHLAGATNDVRKIHDRSSSGCSAMGQDSLNGNSAANAGCHALNKPMVAASIGCGQGTTATTKCHANHTNSNHGISSGGQSCYKCHTVYRDSMNTTGTSAAATVHHVMGTGTQSGDLAPNAGTYPSTKTDVFCVSCHTDHNYFNGAASKAGNLRTTAVTASGATTSATDFIAGGTGVCVSCHDVALAKELGGKQLASGAATTPIILGTDFNASAHNYSVPSTFGASATFNANCSKCHSDEQTKQYSTGKYKFGTHYSATAGILGALGAFTGNPPQEEACYKCHITAAGSGTDLKTVALKDAYGNQSMSTTAEATFGDFAKLSKHDLTKVTCANCHNVHAATSAVPAADPDNTYNVASVATTASANTFCLKCHDGTAPVQVVDGVTLVPYTVSVGTTVNVAANYSTNGHGAPSVGIDCRDCHDQHGSSLVHLLGATVGGSAVATYTDTNDEGYCLACHKAGGFAGASDIARYYPTTASGTADPTMTRSGHRTKTVGTLAIGSAVPCRTCHDPHGGAGSGYMLEVRTQVTPGVDVKIGITAGQLDMSDASQTPTNSVNTREFCFTCHTSSDLVQGWNGSAMANVAVGSKVLGIDRTTSVFLHLPTLPNNIKGHKSADTYSCYLCHGDDFSGAGSVNVHNPAAGESRGGIPCYICHTVYRDKMEDGLGAALGLSNGTGYHHVLGNGTTRQGDSTVTPTLGTDGNTTVYCLSCHVDHDKFSPLVNAGNSRSKNLRNAYDSAASPTSASADWNATSGGVCLGCHNTALTRDNTYQKPETNSSVTASFTSAAYNVSAHQYSVTSTFTDGSIFNAQCVKCHDSEIDGGGMERGSGVAGFQTSQYKFSSHYSSARRLLGSLGVTVTDPPAEENTCYSCHSTSADLLKTVADRDWYNTAAMDANSQNIYDLMASAPAVSTSTNTLYFRPTADANPSEPMPNADIADTVFNGSSLARIDRLMAPGTSSVANETRTGNFGTTTVGNYRIAQFTSLPVATAVNVPAGNWTLNIWSNESNAAANAFVRTGIYKWTAADANGGTFVAVATAATEMNTALGNQAVTLSGSALSLAAGDKIVIVVEAYENLNNATTYSYTFSWGATAASNLVLPANVDFATTPAYTPFGHDVGSYSGLHRTSPTDETQAYISANKHVECTDCHDVHSAGKTSHTAGGATGNAIAAASPITGVSGMIFGVGTSTNWSLTGATTLTRTDAATLEHQICFKCHSKANTALTTWDATWTDQSLEFNPKNKSFHPVIAGSTSTGSGSTALSTAQMTAPWTTVGTQTMMCSDCHGAAGATPAAQGPHGSAVSHMLKGPNTYWPTNASGALYTLGNNPTNNSHLAGLFCTNCHPVQSAAGASFNNAHGQHAGPQLGNVACIRCHILVPHGGKVSRLIATNNAGGMPTRYAYQGNLANVYVTKFALVAAENSYQKDSCTANGTGCTTHSGTAATEQW